MISLIVSVLNDAVGLKRTLISLVAEMGGHEVVVADGGSIDGGLAMVRQMGWPRLVRASGARAARMNAGAAKARGDVLLFLDAGGVLERGWAEAVEDAAGEAGFAVGCFRLAVAGRQPLLRIAEAASRFRTRAIGLARVNQALFVKADDVRGERVFLDAGVLEGVDLCKRLGRRGRLVRLKLVAMVPERRWRDAGAVVRIVRDAVALHRWYYGEQPSRLVDIGGDRRDAVLVFCTNPEPGKVLRWLADRIGRDGAARAYRSGVEHLLAAVARSRIAADAYAFFRPQAARTAVTQWLDGAALPVAQSGRTDRERRVNAVEAVHPDSAGKLLILEVNCPAMSARELREAFRQLNTYDVVLGPTDDGGCYLIGVNRPQSAFFSRLSWDADRLYAAAVAAAADAGLTCCSLQTLVDFDSAEDLPLNWAMGHLQV